jgi:hypothetical protein
MGTKMGSSVFVYLSNASGSMVLVDMYWFMANSLEFVVAGFVSVVVEVFVSAVVSLVVPSFVVVSVPASPVFAPSYVASATFSPSSRLPSMFASLIFPASTS